jgi:peroxiredoxin
MNGKVWVGITALAGGLALVWLAISAIDLNDPALKDVQRLLFIEGSNQFLSASDPVVMEAAPRLGYLAPEFRLDDLTGESRTLSGYRGRPTLVNFWATWCPSCRAELEGMQAFFQNHGDNVQVLGVNWGESAEMIAGFLERLNITFPILLDTRGTAFVGYQLTGVPTSVFLDSEGVIRGIWLGPMSPEEIEAGFARFWLSGGKE